MTEDLMKFTKAELVELLQKATKQLVEKKKKLPGQNYPIQPEVPFDKMGKLEYCRWRVRLVTWRIKNDPVPRTNLYVDSEKRYRVRMMKEFCDWFIELKKENHKEAEKFQVLNDKYLKDIKLEVKTIPVIPSIKLNTSGK